MTNHDVAVATPSNDSNDERPDRSLAEQLVDQARADGKDLVGPGGLLSELTKQVLETGLEVEMEEHLGYAKHAVEGRNHGNSRNGTRSKTVITEIGPVDIDVPRDRDGSFEPATVRKNQRRLDGVDSMVISLTAKGLTTGEVEAHLAEVYSTNISRETISKDHRPGARRACRPAEPSVGSPSRAANDHPPHGFRRGRPPSRRLRPPHDHCDDGRRDPSLTVSG